MHAMGVFDSNAFKQLRRTWYAKLKEDGFEEIEDTEAKDEMLCTWHSHYFERRHTPSSFRATSSYFDQAKDFLHCYDFLNDTERKIWELHANGVSVREIEKKLKIKAWKVQATITELKTQLNWTVTLLS